MERFHVEIPEEYVKDDEYDIHHVIYKSKIPKEKFMFKINIEDNDKDIGEEIGYRIAEAIDIPCCKAKLFKRERIRGDNITYYDYGVGSFYQGDDNEEIILRMDILMDLHWNEASKLYPEITGREYCPGIKDYLQFIDYLLMKENRPKSEFDEIKNKIIEMLVYDIKFGNNDRIGSNFGLIKNKATGKIKFYPLFDNETIFGFDYPTSKLTGHENECDIEAFNHQQQMKFRLDGKQNNTSDYLELLKFLLQTYPEETEKAMEKVRKFRFEELRKMLKEYPNISKTRRSFTEKVFLDRDFRCESIYQKYLNQKIEKTAIEK